MKLESNSYSLSGGCKLIVEIDFLIATLATRHFLYRRTKHKILVSNFINQLILSFLILGYINLFRFHLEIYVNFNKSRVFDCFLYNGEAGMLYTRLWRLDPYVDKFFIYASNISFSGVERNLSTKPFEEKISQYESKIHWITKDAGCTGRDKKFFDGAWCRENTARSSIYPALKQYGPNQEDFIIFSDLDEIPTRYAMEMLQLDPPEQDTF